MIIFINRFIWKRTNAVLGYSEATITWDIPFTTPQGKYRIQHFGHHKNILQHISAFTGTSSVFEVNNTY
jgi:neutral ceramidase